MVRKFIKWMMLLLFVGVLVFSMVAPALATGAQLWYLDSTNHPIAGKVMTKTYNAATGSVTIAGLGGSQLWLAGYKGPPATGEAALVDVVFPDGAWVIHLKTDGYWGPGQTSLNCVVVIGEWDVAEANPLLRFKPFLVNPPTTYSWSSGTHILTVELQIGPQTVHAGNYLALKVTNADFTSGGITHPLPVPVSHRIDTNGSSWVESPQSDPGYPVPEIATGVLLGLGMLGLVGFVVIRRRARASAKA